MIEDNLTREEARQRAELLHALTYEVSLDLTFDQATNTVFTAETRLRFSAREAGVDTFIDLDAERVREATLNGEDLDPDSYDGERSRLPLPGLRAYNELRVVAECAYQHTGVGLHRVLDPVDNKVYLHTQFEPYDAHRVFACFDQPDLKATFTLDVTAPDGWTVISNGPVTERTGRLWRFAPTPPISTYLVAVVAGPYHAVTERHRTIDLGLYCRESLAAHLDPEEIFTVTRQGFDFFETEFGYPYPFAKYDQLFVPEFNFGAMENPGCVTFNESFVFRSRMTDAAYERRAEVILHEMAHMWFGDLVTMRWWDDLWLNESFATYMATHSMVRATRFKTGWVRFATGTKASAVSQDELPSTHPISADIVDTDAVRLHFDGITYSKGASALKQLVAWVGQRPFIEGLRQYFRKYEWANAELADFLHVLEEASGRDLGSWSKEWLETAGVNTLRPSFELDGGRYRSFAIVQEAKPEQPTLRSHRVAIGLYRMSDGGLVRRRRIEFDVVGPRTEVPELEGEPAAELLVLNDDDLTYAKVRLDTFSLATMQEHLSVVVDPLARSLCWASAWDMVRDAELATRRYVALVSRHAAAETDDTSLQRLLGQASLAADVYGNPDNRAALRAQLADDARIGLDQAEPSSDRQLVWARHLLSVGDGEDDIAFARSLLDGSREVPGLAVDTDLRWHVVAVLASKGADDDGALIDAELTLDPTDIGERRAAACRASRPTNEAKAAAWKQLMEESPHLALVRAVASGFAQFGQEELLRPYVEPYFSSIRRVWDERSLDEALTLLRGLYPGTLIEESVVAATDAALADDTLPGPVVRILAEGKDGVERALRGRAADRALPPTSVEAPAGFA